MTMQLDPDDFVIVPKVRRGASGPSAPVAERTMRTPRLIRGGPMGLLRRTVRGAGKAALSRLLGSRLGMAGVLRMATRTGGAAIGVLAAAIASRLSGRTFGNIGANINEFFLGGYDEWAMALSGTRDRLGNDPNILARIGQLGEVDPRFAESQRKLAFRTDYARERINQLFEQDERMQVLGEADILLEAMSRHNPRNPALEAGKALAEALRGVDVSTPTKSRFYELLERIGIRRIEGGNR